MKNTIIFLFLISLLLQSCYSYKAISLKETPLIVGKNYKIKQEDKFVKTTLKTVNDSTLTVLVGKTEKQISVSSIKEIKAQKFSVLKTVSLVPIIYAGITVIYVVSALSQWGQN